MLDHEQIWLAHYMQLSRPRSLKTMISHGMPDRNVIEGGPPQRIQDELDRLFKDKIAATEKAAALARKQLKWPPRL